MHAQHPRCQHIYNKSLGEQAAATTNGHSMCLGRQHAEQVLLPITELCNDTAAIIKASE